MNNFFSRDYTSRAQVFYVQLSPFPALALGQHRKWTL